MNLTQYFARQGSRFSNRDAQIIGPELQNLAGKTTEEIWKAASHKQSPLHPYVEWDKNKAALNYQYLQVQDMVRSIHVRAIVDGRPQEFQAFQKISVTTIDPSDERKDKRGHPIKVIVATEEAAKAEAQKAEILDRARMDLAAFKRRYLTYRTIFSGNAWESLFAAIDQLTLETEAEQDLAAD